MSTSVKVVYPLGAGCRRVQRRFKAPPEMTTDKMLHLLLLPTIIACTINVPREPSDDAALVDPSFPNLSFEFASLLNFATTSQNDSSPNQYSINLMHEVYKRTGGHPKIRVGGTSGDFAIYNASQHTPVIPIPGEASGQDNGGTFFGPNFWPLTRNFESLHATWIPQISLANNNMSQVIAQGRAALNGVHSIEALEMGNEPNLYPNGMSTQEWSGTLNDSTYAARWVEYASAISNATIWQGIDYAAFSGGLTVPGAFADGLNSTGLVKQIAAHYYQNSGTDNSFASLMNHSKTVSEMALIKSWTAYGDVLVDEANTLTGPTNATFQQSLGAAVWKVDFMLYCMSIGIKSVHFESVFGSNQAMWKPWSTDGSPAFTGSGYYSLLPAADFLAGHARIQQLFAQDNFTVYASYKNDLQRIAILNLDAWSGDNRPNTTVVLNGMREGQVMVKYLDCPGGAACPVAQMTYGGSQWTAESNGLEASVDKSETEYLDVKEGTVDIQVPATSVAIVFV